MSFKNQSSGSALVVVIILTAVLFSVVTAYLNVMMSEKRQILSSQNNLKAMSIAEAGLEHAFWEFLHNAAQFKPSDGWVVHPTINDTVSKSVNDFTNNLSAAIGSYTVQVQDFSSESPLITSTGSVTSAGAGTSAMIKAGVKKNEVFNHAILAEGQIGFKQDAYVDSYDSTKGTYNAPLTGGSTNKNDAGHVQTNSRKSGTGDDSAINLNSTGVKVGGNAMTGPEGKVDFELRVQVAGDIEHESDVIIDPVTVPIIFDGVGVNPSLDIGGSEVTTLPPGNYAYQGINIEGSEDGSVIKLARLEINGDVNIYVTGDMIIKKFGQLNLASGASLNIYIDGKFDFKQDGEVNNQSLQPNLLRINLTSAQEVSIKQDAVVYGIVNAPNGSLNLKQGAVLHGAAIVDTALLQQNGAIHYDESLGTAGGTNAYEMTWWRRM
jgi:Tfp pilus assembly protein PilX